MKQTAAEAFAPLLQRLNEQRAVDLGIVKSENIARRCPECGKALESFRGRNSSEKAGKDVFLIVHCKTAEPCPLRFETLAKGFSEDEAWGKLNGKLTDCATKGEQP